jgi:hypothetical protein
MTRTRGQREKTVSVSDETSSVREDREVTSVVDHASPIDVDKNTAYCCKRENSLLRKRIEDLSYIVKLQKDVIASLGGSNKQQVGNTRAISTNAKPVPASEKLVPASVKVDNEALTYSMVASRKSQKSCDKQARSGPHSLRAKQAHTETDLSTEESKVNNDNFELISTKRNRSKTNNKKMNVTICTGTEANSFIAAAPHKTWLHIGKVQKDVSADSIISYVKSKIPDGTFICEKLNSLGENSSFKLGADGQVRETLEDPAFWPTGITLRRFFLNRPRTDAAP